MQYDSYSNLAKLAWPPSNYVDAVIVTVGCSRPYYIVYVFVYRLVLDSTHNERTINKNYVNILRTTNRWETKTGLAAEKNTYTQQPITVWNELEAKKKIFTKMSKI